MATIDLRLNPKQKNHLIWMAAQKYDGKVSDLVREAAKRVIEEYAKNGGLQNA